MLGRKLNFQLSVMFLMLLTTLSESRKTQVAQHSTAKQRPLSSAHSRLQLCLTDFYTNFHKHA